MAAMWRKRSKLRPVPAWAFICLACGLVFLFGNLLLLHDGFAQLYDSTFSQQQSVTHEEIRYIPPVVINYGNQVDRTLTDSIIYLPQSALDTETHLRKLMQESTIAQSSGDTQIVAVTPHDLRQTLSQTSQCNNDELSRQEHIASGWTKAVFKGVLWDLQRNSSEKVAIKMIDRNGYDVKNCVSDEVTEEQCYKRADNKMLKEMVLLQGLQHPHVVKVTITNVTRVNVIAFMGVWVFGCVGGVAVRGVYDAGV